MFTLLKYDPVIRRTRWVCLLAVPLSVVCLPILVGLTSDPKPSREWSLRMVLIALSMQYLFFHARDFSIKERVSGLERSLPVTLRSTYFQKMLSLWIALVAPLLTAIFIFAAYLGLGEGMRVLLTAGSRVLLSITAGIVMLFGWYPLSFRLTTWQANVLACVALLVVFVPNFIKFDHCLLLHGAISVVGLAWIFTRLPKGMPGDASLENSSRSTDAGQPLWSRFVSPMNWVVMRATFLRPSAIWIYSGCTFMLLSSPISGSLFGLWFSALMVFHAVTMGTALLNGLDPLPISRTRLLPYIVLPSLILIVMAFGILSLKPRKYTIIDMFSHSVQIENNFEPTFGTEGEFGTHVLVPAYLWQWSATGKVQTTTSPWGETNAPQLHPIFPGSPLSLFNPYDVSNANTVRFATWQLSRTLTEVYGMNLSQEQVHKRWYSDFDSKSLIDDNYKITQFAPDWSEKAPKSIPNRPGIAALFGVLLWFLTARFVMRKNVPRLARRAAAIQGLSHWAVPLALFMALVGFMFLYSHDRAVAPAFFAKIHDSLDALLGSSPLAWVALILTVATGCYWVLRSRILKLEVPTLPKSGWTKKEISIF